MKKTQLTQKEARYVFADVVDSTNNIYLSDIQNDLYYITCHHMTGKYYVTFQSKAGPKVNNQSLRNNYKHVKPYFANTTTLDIDVKGVDEFQIVATYNDYKKIITSLRQQHISRMRERRNENCLGR